MDTFIGTIARVWKWKDVSESAGHEEGLIRTGSHMASDMLGASKGRATDGALVVSGHGRWARRRAGCWSAFWSSGSEPGVGTRGGERKRDGSQWGRSSAVGCVRACWAAGVEGVERTRGSAGMGAGLVMDGAKLLGCLKNGEKSK